MSGMYAGYAALLIGVAITYWWQRGLVRRERTLEDRLSLSGLVPPSQVHDARLQGRRDIIDWVRMCLPQDSVDDFGDVVKTNDEIRDWWLSVEISYARRQLHLIRTSKAA